MYNIEGSSGGFDPSIGTTFDEDCLILALDFGTTFSGVAYAFTNDHEKIYTVDSWPGADDRIVPKTPTTLQYEHDSITKFKWGYQLDQSNEEKIVGLKLLLDPDQNCPYQIPADTQTEIEQLPKPVVEIASDYIRSIFQHALKEIEKGYFPGFINGFKKQYILTVPAVWSDPAKALTERAARNAGISPVDMITEPEAAALYTLQTMKDKGLKDGDAIIICDAGGGTVDLISYEIVSQSPFHVKALTIPSGGAHGSLMLNKSFEKEVRNIVGEDAFQNLKKTPGYQSAMREFDLVHKLSFRGQGDADRYVSFPMANLEDNKAKGLMKNSITLSGQTMLRIFDPIIQEIDKLVSDQVKESTYSGRSSVEAIFLVGGFGASEFLKERIQASNPGIRVLQPKEAWSSIAKGAVISKLTRGLNHPTIVSTKATKHYGVEFHSEWDHFRDMTQPMRQYPYFDGYRCDLMQWYILKGDELVRGKKYSYSFNRRVSGHYPTSNDLKFTDRLLYSSTVSAPTHPDKNIISTNCILETDLSEIPDRFFERRQLNGSLFTAIAFNIILENLPSGLMKFSLEVGGQEYSAVKATY